MDLIGILGGAFNPPHKEHIRICNELTAEFRLKQVYLVPTKDAPHKEVGTPFDIRCRMIEAAISSYPHLGLDKIEQSMEGTTYSVRVLKELKEKYGNIAFIIGGDSMQNFSSWEQPDSIIKICPLIVVPRGDICANLTQAVRRYKDKGAEILVSKTIGREISSSLIRAHVELGLDTEEYLDGKCREIIDRNGLYREYSGVIAELKANVSPARYRHTVDTIITAFELNDTWGIPYEKVFVAALLHDCMKDSEVIHDEVPKDTYGTLVMHAFNGAIEASKKYNVTDSDVLNAIRYHTTCRPGMSRLEKLIYLADMIEPGRVYPEAEHIRKTAYADTEQGFLSAFHSAYKHITNTMKNIYPLTTESYNYYFKGENT